MNKRILSIIVIIIFVLIIAVLGAIYNLFYNINNIPIGILLTSSDSPNHKYTVNIYQVNTHATVSYAVRGEVINNQTKKRRNIYWQYRIENAVVKWNDEETVVINGKTLNVKKDKYDFRVDSKK